ncbi:MAG TPA: hypothetical protein VFU25_00945 [Ornithinibacter sp.]|nr:hypothetical protein [Ornithinibacter sp.]
MRQVAGLTAFAVVATLFAGCGQQAADPPEKKAASTPQGAGRPWLLRLDSYSGEDGETQQATYLTITPTSGDVVEVSTPRLQAAEASGDERLLLVDADHSSALLDSRPTKQERAAGHVTLYELTKQGRTSTVDVRKATGDRNLTPDWVVFDPTKPDTLRVVDGLTVWVVPTDGSRATKEGVLPSRPGWIFAGGFNKNDGLPFIEDTDSFQTIPKGNGETSTRAVVRTTGTVVPSDNGGFPGLPEAHCGLGTAFALAHGPTWAFCVRQSRIRARVLEPGASQWEDAGKPTGDVVASNAEPTFVLPAP